MRHVTVTLSREDANSKNFCRLEDDFSSRKAIRPLDVCQSESLTSLNHAFCIWTRLRYVGNMSQDTSEF